MRFKALGFLLSSAKQISSINLYFRALFLGVCFRIICHPKNDFLFFFFFFLKLEEVWVFVQ